MPGNNLKLADDFAAEYDSSVLHNNWNGPEILFEATKDLLQSKSEILDLGIGTGESSKLSELEGHRITGLDGSEKMLEQCKNKHIGSEYINHDLEKFPYPIEDQQFNAIISNGVFHLVYPFLPIIEEVKRMLRPNGIFAFTYENTNDRVESREIKSGIWERETKSGVLTYKYSDEIIDEYLNSNSFKLVVRKEFLAFTNQKVPKDIYFTAIVAQLQ